MLLKLLRSPWRWPVLLTASALLCGSLFFADLETPVRPLVGFWFLLVCPGMAIVRVFDVQNALLEWVLAMALSIALSGIISNIQIYTATWSPTFAMGVLIGLTLVGVLIQGLLNLKIIAWPSTDINLTGEGRKPGSEQ